MKGAKIIVECLIEQGVEFVFGYPGGYIIDVFDELHVAQQRITQVLTCHEQGASHAADGYARVSGKVGVVISTSGPGATNLVTGLATANMDSVPMVAITGNVPLNYLGRDSFQEVDITSVTMPVTKHNYIVKDIAQLASTIREAFFVAASGRPGPVLIDIPKNIQQADYEYTPQVPRPISHKLSVTDNIAEAVEAINNSKRPLLYVGGGVICSNASAQLLEFARLIDAPVASSIMGLGAFPASDPLYLGLIGMHGHHGVAKSIKECDTLIAIGARFSDRVAGDRSKFAAHAKIIHIDIDNAEIDKNVITSHHIMGDVGLVLSHIMPQIQPRKNSAWVEQTRAFVDSSPSHEAKQKLNPHEIIRTLCRLTPPSQIIATDVGQHQMWTVQSYKFENPRTLVTSGGLGTMGFGLGASIGASMASKSRVVLVTGDGSFHMNMNEVVTATRLGLPIVILLFNNNVLGMVRQWQKLFYCERYSSTTLNFPTRYDKLAEAFGASYELLEANSDIESVLTRALASKGVVLVNCKLYSDECVLPMIPAGKSLDDIITEIY